MWSLAITRAMACHGEQGTMYYWTHSSEYNFEKVQFWTKVDLLNPMGPGQEFPQRQHIHSQKCLISV